MVGAHGTVCYSKIFTANTISWLFQQKKEFIRRVPVSFQNQ